MMNINDALAMAEYAVSANPDRPATAIIHDSADARLVVFRIETRQAVPLHSSTSSVILVIIRGVGFVSGPVDGGVSEREVHQGTVVTYEPGEFHGMRATSGPFVVLAIIVPRPGSPRMQVAQQ